MLAVFRQNTIEITANIVNRGSCDSESFLHFLNALKKKNKKKNGLCFVLFLIM